jgi:hypothetical protein
VSKFILGGELGIPLFEIKEAYSIFTYFYPIWAIDFLNLTDLETLGIIAYVAYPAA